MEIMVRQPVPSMGNAISCNWNEQKWFPLSVLGRISIRSNLKLTEVVPYAKRHNAFCSLLIIVELLSLKKIDWPTLFENKEHFFVLQQSRSFYFSSIVETDGKSNSLSRCCLAVASYFIMQNSLYGSGSFQIFKLFRICLTDFAFSRFSTRVE